MVETLYVLMFCSFIAVIISVVVFRFFLNPLLQIILTTWSQMFYSIFQEKD